MSPTAATEPATSLRDNIAAVLEQITHAEDFDTAARDLLEVLGYPTGLTLPDQSGNVDDFIHLFDAPNPGTNSEQALWNEDPTIKLLCQVTDDSLDLLGQHTLLEQHDIDKDDIHSFLFVAVDLKQDTYRRTKYAQYTREINKRFAMPTVVLYRTAAATLTVAFADRCRDKRDPDRDVLGKVSLIRDIDLSYPHPAHLRLLEQLSIAALRTRMHIRHQAPNFDGLLKSWRDTLNTDILNKQFYRSLFAWFQRAVDEATFPTADGGDTQQEVQVIRLITRLLFIWFMKEKELVAPELFAQGQAEHLLRDYDHDHGDSYYTAILQNLFFATLNTEYDQPGSRRSLSHYLYHDKISQPDRLLDLFNKTPFINGGLFDCLDTDTGQLIDGYTDNPEHQALLSVPNRLFFDDDGIVTLLDSYKFTLEENTPIDEDVALDPELLGKVFENLLAAHDPETRTTVRERTGSYYTPRPIVDYMVDEALIPSLATTCAADDSNGQVTEEILRHLLHHGHDFDATADALSDHTKQGIVHAIATIKILDASVGSGAFPMAVLNKLTLALRRLDPENLQWKALQQQIAAQRARTAFQEDDQAIRDEQLQSISDTFEKYRNDFGRKLYLIQNSIYGVDIQPIACQIAKLRFFISLAIDQTPDTSADNHGIRPLPNLETKFVCADTLIGLQGQQGLIPPDAQDLLQQLDINREQHFLAGPQRKHSLRDEHRQLRTALASELAAGGMRSTHTDRIAAWDPYDQNKPAGWFDSTYMFGTTDGFNIVIGNPPYIQLQRDKGRLSHRYENTGYTSFARFGDIYYLFYEKGITLLKPGQGILAYITSNSWMKAKYADNLRRYVTAHTTPIALIDMGKDVFDAIVSTNILTLRQGSPSPTEPPFPAVGIDTPSADAFPPHQNHWDAIRPHREAPWIILSPLEAQIMHKIRTRGTPLKQWDIMIRLGVKTGLNEAFLIDQNTRDTLCAEDPRSDHIVKPILRGKDIKRYRAEWAGEYLIATHNGYGSVPATNPDDYPAIKRHLQKYSRSLRARSDQGCTPYNLRSCAHWDSFAGEKLFIMDMAARVAYADTTIYCKNTGYIVTGTSLKYLCALLNSALITWLMTKNALTSGAGAVRWMKFTVERIPIPIIPYTQQQSFTRLVDSILDAKDTDLQADTHQQETELDQLVYQLYGLTDDEVAVIGSSTH